MAAIHKGSTLLPTPMPLQVIRFNPKETVMKSTLKLSLIGALLAVAGVSFAMGPMGGGQCDPMMGGMQGQYSKHGRMGKGDPARMQAMMEQRQAAIKAQLKLTAVQEPAWASYTAAVKPPAGLMAMQRPDPAEMAKLSTPERIEKMKKLQTERHTAMTTAMDKRAEATKVFYAVLTPEQQKTFDAATLPGQGRGQGSRQGPRPGQGPMQPKS